MRIGFLFFYYIVMSDKSIRAFSFPRSQETDNCSVSIYVYETVSSEYHAFIWPCAVVLGQFICYWHGMNKSKLSSLSQQLAIIEIGAGCSLPSLLFAKLIQISGDVSPRIISTDGHRYFTKFAEQLKKSCDYNRLVLSSEPCNRSGTLEFYSLSWGRSPKDFPSDIISTPSKILLCADCFYDSKDFDDVVVTIAYLLHGGKFSNKNQTDSKFLECWCTVQIRSENHSIAALLEKWHLTFEKVPLSSFGADSDSLAGSNLPGQSTVEMYIFRPNHFAQRS